MKNFNSDYKESKMRVEDILNSKTLIKDVEQISDDESGFTYENGVRTWIAAMFIDIRNSSALFNNNKQETIARIMRAFTSEVIQILRQNPKCVQIGIRGDCVYGIYSVQTIVDLNNIMLDACYINTFQRMFQIILSRKGWPTFQIGIGLGASKALVIKAGKKGTGINDNIWIGDAVIDAVKLSGEGNKNNVSTIVMDNCFYNNIKDFAANSEHLYSFYITNVRPAKFKQDIYHCDMVLTDFNNWIKTKFAS